MKKIRVFIILASLCLSNFAMAAPMAIEGVWGMRVYQNGLTFDMSMTIGNNLVTMQNICSGGGGMSRVQVTVPAQYTEQTFTVLGSAHDQQNSPDGSSCYVNIQPMSVTYEVVGSQLHLTQPGSSQELVLTRQGN